MREEKRGLVAHKTYPNYTPRWFRGLFMVLLEGRQMRIRAPVVLVLRSKVLSPIAKIKSCSLCITNNVDRSTATPTPVRKTLAPRRLKQVR